MEDFFIRFLIIQENALECDVLATCLCYEFQRVIENGERGKPEEIHLQQAHLLDGDHVERSDNFVVFGLVQGNELGQRTRRNDYSRGMHAGVADQAFQLARGIQQLPDLAVAFVRLL